MFAMANHTVDGKRIFPTLKVAKEAVEKQIPKKPIANKVKAEKVKVGNGWWCKGTTIHKCPICDEYAGRTSKYCNQCGQALDWSDTDEQNDR